MFIRERLVMYLFAEALLGVGWGLFQGIVLPYVFDITPLPLKGPASTLLNVYWLAGQIVCSGVLRGAVELGDTMWQVRIPMLWQYTWLWLLAVVVHRAPESPMYMIRNDKSSEAGNILSRLNRDPRFDEYGHVAMLQAINDHERSISSNMGFMTCFSTYNLRRTEVAMVVYATQQLVGTPLISYSTKMLGKGGLGAAQALEFNIGMWTWCMGATFASIIAFKKLGRRTMWLGGLAASTILHLLSGTMALFPETCQGVMSYIIAAVLILFATTFNFTLGPVGYAIIGEVPATRLKTATNSLARGGFILVNIVNLFLVPKLLEDKPYGWGAGARTSLLYAFTSALCFLWAWFRLPETKGLTPAQIDHMFERYRHSQAPSMSAPRSWKWWKGRTTREKRPSTQTEAPKPAMGTL